MHPPLHFTFYCPQFCLPHSSPLQPCISLWLGSGSLGQEIPHQQRQGTGDGILGLSVLEETCPTPTLSQDTV